MSLKNFEVSFYTAKCSDKYTCLESHDTTNKCSNGFYSDCSHQATCRYTSNSSWNSPLSKLNEIEIYFHYYYFPAYCMHDHSNLSYSILYTIVCKCLYQELLINGMLFFKGMGCGHLRLVWLTVTTIV